jgi:hypothetical protein
MNKDTAIKYIKSGLGAPIIDGFEITDSDIELLALDKSLLEYYKRYPLEVSKDYPKGTTLQKSQYPGGEERTLGILNFNFTSASEYVDPSIDDPFGLSRRLIDLDIDHAMPGVLAQRTTISSLRRPSFSLVKDDVTGTIKMSSMYDGFFRVKWGLLGDIEQAPLVRLYDILDLAVSYLQIYIGQTRSLIKFPGEVQFDAATLVANGEKRKEEILKKWIVISAVMTIR